MEENTAKVLKNVSSIAKAYVRISSVKTALTVALVAYTALKIVQTFKE